MKESKERGIYVNGLGQHVVTGVPDMMRKLQVCEGGVLILFSTLLLPPPPFPLPPRFLTHSWQ